ncbi:hypothetical protein OSB04_025390 [Centaurea solstitialis]|uniref:DC1 domain-containing protein n=1 Tax=Centaurea solstitialis TaxID=347529 RepID=A0AA38SNL6_9ASTR|nr:hypothetical protein OSB04_025390 [Centaurea solstitialis]
MPPLQRSTNAPPPAPPPPEIQHYAHRHPLQKLFMGSQFSCDGCNTAGYEGIRYRCSACDFDLHEQCATAPHRIFSHVHPHHQLSLVHRAGLKYTCDVCSGVADGISYTCQTCGFDVHPPCTMVPMTPYLQPGPAGTPWGPPMVAASRGQHHEQPLPVQVRSNNYAKVAKFAANILMTSMTGMPMNFNSTNNPF